MDTILACLHGAAYVAAALALPLCALRRTAMVVLLLAALGSLGAGFAAPGPRTLTTVHSYAGFVGASQEVSMRAFPTGEAAAAGWLWPLPFAAFALLWVLVLRGLGDRRPARPWLLPLSLAWTATAAWLGLQALAAPAATVQPLGLDRFLFPAGLALALLAARSAAGLRALLFTISAGTLAARLPAALWSKLASDLRLGTCLDVTPVRDIVNPMTGLLFDPRLLPGSPEQQFWLIWLEHVVMFPALYLLSLFGIGFAVHMYHRHGA
ncbi:MAG: hypothetical protein FJ265_03985 [Planctomycetes bacterium]|nr:hypothetical protein [Planctomycetota bacterium]